MQLDLTVKGKAKLDKLLNFDFLRKLEDPIYLYKVVPHKKKKGKFGSTSIFETQLKLVPQMTSQSRLVFHETILGIKPKMHPEKVRKCRHLASTRSVLTSSHVDWPKES